jgi:hypothetical protein
VPIALKNSSWTVPDRDSLMRLFSGGSGHDGRAAGVQESLFYEFRLEDHVPSDHLLRRIDRFVDCSELRQHLAGFYSTTGRPSVNPLR